MSHLHHEEQMLFILMELVVSIQKYKWAKSASFPIGILEELFLNFSVICFAWQWKLRYLSADEILLEFHRKLRIPARKIDGSGFLFPIVDQNSSIIKKQIVKTVAFIACKKNPATQRIFTCFSVETKLKELLASKIQSRPT